MVCTVFSKSGVSRRNPDDYGQQDHEGLLRTTVQEQGEGSHASLLGCHSEGPNRRAPAEGQSTIQSPGKGLSPTAEGRVRAQPELNAEAAWFPLEGLAPARAHCSSNGSSRNISLAAGMHAGGLLVPGTSKEFGAGAPVYRRDRRNQPHFSDVSDDSAWDVYDRFLP